MIRALGLEFSDQLSCFNYFIIMKRNLQCTEDMYQFQDQRISPHPKAYVYSFEIQKVLMHQPPSALANQYPLSSVMRIIANLLQFNLFQAIAYRWLLGQSKWSSSSQTLIQPARIWSSLVSGKSTNKRQWLQTQALLIMTAWFVKRKMLLNRQKLCELQCRLGKRLMNFKNFYEQWSEKSEVPFEMLSLQLMNNLLYEYLPQTQSCEENLNYNSLVDKIITLSYAYNTKSDKITQEIQLKPKKKIVIDVRKSKPQEDQVMISRPAAVKVSTLRSRGHTYLFQQFQNNLIQDQNLGDSIRESRANQSDMLLDSRHWSGNQVIDLGKVQLKRTYSEIQQ